MNIAIIGYGKMGREIEAIALERGHTVCLTIDLNNSHELTAENLQRCDVAIEFTSPETAVGNLKACFAAGVPVVCGSTGWLDRMEEVRGSCAERGGGFFYTSNFSVGVNVFFRLNSFLAKLMAKVDGYRVGVEEIHHTAKKDAPSGTAITIAEGIMAAMPQLGRWVNRAQAADNELSITSVRQDPAPGTHTVSYGSDIDLITIRHEAKSRKGFALGAVLAAEFMQGKRGCFGMDDLLKL